MAIEAIRRAFSRGAKEIEEPPFPQMIEPVPEEQRTILLKENNKLISKWRMSGDNFNKFTSNMIKLLGGEREDKNNYRSNFLNDPSRKVAYTFGRSLEYPERIGWIEIAPDWFAIEEKRREFLNSRRQPLITERFNYGITLRSKNVYSISGIGDKDPYVTYLAYIPSGYNQPTFTSNFTGISINPLEAHGFVRYRLSTGTVQAACVNALLAFEQQQLQSSFQLSVISSDSKPQIQ